MNLISFLKTTKYYVRAKYFWKPNSQVESALFKIFGKKNDVQFIQIGSNNGIDFDPIFNLAHKYQWRGTLIEPIDEIYTKLKQNYFYRRKNMEFVKKAIGSSNSSCTFYSIDKRSFTPDTPIWLGQIGSLSRDHVTNVSKGYPNLKIKETTVNQIKFDTLIDQYDCQDVDLLHIDAEGFDFEIIDQIDFNKFETRALLYETEHMTKYQQEQTELKLKKAGYSLNEFSYDTLAVK